MDFLFDITAGLLGWLTGVVCAVFADRAHRQAAHAVADGTSR